MSSRRGGKVYTGTGASDPSVKGKISIDGSCSDIDQISQGVEGISVVAGQDDGWEVFSRKSKNKAGNNKGKQLVPHSTTSKAWGDPATRQKLGMQSNFDSKMAGGRGNTKPQSLNQGYDIRNPASSLVMQPTLRNGWDWNKRASSPQSSYNHGSKNNVAINNTENAEDVKIDEFDDDDDPDVLDDTDDEILSDNSDSDCIGKGHEMYKKNRWFKELFDVLDSLTVEQIHEPERQWHCPVCKGGPGAIDWYKLQPLVTHAKTNLSKRVKLHRKLAQVLEEELRLRGTSLIPAGEIFGVWRGLDVKVEKEIVWPPMVMIMNTSHDQDEKGQSIGMGNQELLDYFSDYDAVKARHAYGPKGHRGIGVLIFEASAIGYLEAERLSKHFEDNGRDKAAWQSGRSAFYFGGQRQLYGYMAEKRDLDYFNLHSTGKMRLKFEMRSYQEMVVKQLKQMSEDNQQLILYKDKVAKEQKHSKAIEEAYGMVSERYRKTLEENRIVRQRTKKHYEQNKEEMDSQEKFFKEQLKIMYEARKVNEENFEKIQQEERESVKQSHVNPSSMEDHRRRAEEVAKFIQCQEQEMEEFATEREKLIELHAQRMLELKRRHWEEQVALEKKFDDELAQLMSKYTPNHPEKLQ